MLSSRFALGAGPVPALLCSEIFPSSARGAGMSLTMLTHWVRKTKKHLVHEYTNTVHFW